MLPTHQLVILTKMRNNRARIVNFLLVSYFGPSLTFFGKVSISFLFIWKFQNKKFSLVNCSLKKLSFIIVMIKAWWNDFLTFSYNSLESILDSLCCFLPKLFWSASKVICWILILNIFCDKLTNITLAFLSSCMKWSPTPIKLGKKFI